MAIIDRHHRRHRHTRHPAGARDHRLHSRRRRRLAVPPLPASVSVRHVAGPPPRTAAGPGAALRRARCFTTWALPSATAAPPCASRSTAPTRRGSSCWSVASTRPTPDKVWLGIALHTTPGDTRVPGARNRLGDRGCRDRRARHRPRRPFSRMPSPRSPLPTLVRTSSGGSWRAFNDGMKYRPQTAPTGR